MAKKEPEELSKDNPVGGVAFFTSLLFLCFLGAFNSLTLLSILSLESVWRWCTFIGAMILAYVLSPRIFPERFCVFIHELKHSIVSNLAGNRAKKFKVEDATGSFTYEYTKKTAAYNAFIALAPYWFPLFTIVGLPIAIIALRDIALIPVLVAGLLWGADSAFNMRDVSPHQTDISGIRGGVSVGLLYISAMNVTLFTILGAWVTSGGDGLYALGLALWNFLHDIATTVFQMQPRSF